MRCQYIDDSGQCQKEATRDIRVVTARYGLRIFLCLEHVEVEMQKLRTMVDRLVPSPVEKGN